MRGIPSHCNCIDYAVNTTLINAPYKLEYARNPDTYLGYTGKKFKFCPWCGSELIALEVVPTPVSAGEKHV